MKKLLKYLTAVIIVCFLSVAGGLYWTIVLEPGEEIKIDNIRRILGKESHVFYSDGKTRLGVFFDNAHRQYVPYGEIPDVFVNALVASEDDRFFEHIGFDIIGITRAMLKNIAAGRVVQGGSTLTQQTAKNLFRRSERSFEAKFKELLFALRLEYHYSKEQIFEFYINQFYVSGNGHGLGVAARYYFDKKTSELNLVESAFIA
ncbi:MAG: transglycosylase domain-containing protein, partial [Desulfobulbaceae bacterium]|nr:transglycosylase domain-containing protein [Desulfobulbaceae bacterium]